MGALWPLEVTSIDQPFFYDGTWKAELGMTTKIVVGKPWARFGSRKRDLSVAEPCAAETANQELVELGCQFYISDPEYGGLCADYSALSDDGGLSTTPLLPSCYPNNQGFYSNSS
jgi:hypothetical protein